jgi:hypothetical protein
MSKHLLRSGPSSGRGRGRARTVSALVVGALTASALAVIAPALATTTVSGGDVGTNPPVIRGDSTTITADVSALTYYKTASVATIANTAYAPASLNTLKALALGGQLCRGNNPTGVNNTAKTVITVTDPSNAPVATATSPARDVSLFGSGAPFATQPAPNDTNYLGDYTGTSTTHGMSLSLSLAGRPSGTYTVKTTNYNTIRYRSTGTGGITSPCVVGVPDPANGNKSVIPGAVETTTTFIYRPWQEQFVDVFGNGKVQANVTPAENQFTVGTKTTPIYAGNANNTKFYQLPSGADFALPSDPAACAANPAACLPATAVQCVPGPGCVPRLMIINMPIGQAPTTPNGLVGVFDLDTQAFIALAKVDGTQRVLSSLGTELDAQYHDALVKLATYAAAHGTNLNTILATRVKVNNGQYETSLSLLNALQIDPSNAHGGIQIVSDATAQAGLILDIYADIVPSACITKSASNTSVPARFTPQGVYGYTVAKSDVLPDVPAAGPLGTIAGGPVFHITGKFRKQTEGALVDTASAVLGLDTAANEPNGYPVWLEPFVSAGAVATPHTMDFIGTATWSASESNVLGSCLVIDFMLGTGVAVFNYPLPIGLGTLFDPLYKPSPAGEQLNTALSAAIAQATDPVTTNPTVAALLAQILAALPV